MKWTRTMTAGVLALLVSSGAARAQTSLTIYSDGRILQRRTLLVRVPAGVSTHRLALGQLDLGSMFALDSGVAVTGASYDAAVDEANTLRRSVGQRLAFLIRSASGARDTVMAEVVGVDPERYRLADGRITFERPGTPLFPTDAVLTQPSVTIAVRSDRARTALGLGFFAGGAGWTANYAIVLGNRGTARIVGQAVIQPGTTEIAEAEVQLLAGQVGRAAKGRPVADAQMMRAAAAMEGAASQQQVGEAHLYTLPGRLALVPGVETSAMLFEPTNAGYERTYTVRGQIPYWGGLPQDGDEATEPVAVTYVIKRPLKTEFGDRPVPGGIARIYERDAQGRAQLVGEANLDHTAPGQDLRLDAGTAFDLTAKRLQSAYESRREGQRTIAMASYAVTIANAKDSAVIVDVLEQRGGEWSVVQSSLPAEKVSSTITRFRVRVPAKGEANLTYRVRVVW
jgi:hypothetical protein